MCSFRGWDTVWKHAYIANVVECFVFTRNSTSLHECVSCSNKVNSLLNR